MPFIVKRNTNIRKPMEEIPYLNRIGVRYIFGKELDNKVVYFMVDESRNAYLVPTGMSNPNRDGGDHFIRYYTFCLGEMLYKLEIIEYYKTEPKDSRTKEHWAVSFVDTAQDPALNGHQTELYEMIKEALTAKLYDTYKYNPEKCKDYVIEFMCK